MSIYDTAPLRFWLKRKTMIQRRMPFTGYVNFRSSWILNLRGRKSRWTFVWLSCWLESLRDFYTTADRRSPVQRHSVSSNVSVAEYRPAIHPRCDWCQPISRCTWRGMCKLNIFHLQSKSMHVFHHFFQYFLFIHRTHTIHNKYWPCVETLLLRAKSILLPTKIAGLVLSIFESCSLVSSVSACWKAVSYTHLTLPTIYSV